MINLGIFKIRIESWSKWIWITVNKYKDEVIIDFGFWRLYIFK
jgi:hypothetical protein